MPELLNPGRSYIAEKQAAHQPVIVNRFVFANVPGLDPGANISLSEGLPPAEQIVGTYDVSGDGYVSPDRVVYSVILGPTVGPFEFNWVGLLTDDNRLFAVSHIPLTEKFNTVGSVLGNTLTRNFLVEYTNAQLLTGITVEAGTWQIDFTARFNQQTDVLQNMGRDFFGTQFFIGDGFKVIRQGAQWKLSAGVGYVGGIRITNALTTSFDAGDLPADIWLDVYLDKNISSVDAIFTIAPLPAGTPLTDYTAPNGVKHYVAKIALLTSNAVYTDLRRVVNNVDGVVADLYQDWLNFLTDFGGKTDYQHLTVNTQLEKNSRYFSDAGLEHVFPPSLGLNVGDAIRLMRPIGKSVKYSVFNLGTDLFKLDESITDTAVLHDDDSVVDAVWNGSAWEIQ